MLWVLIRLLFSIRRFFFHCVRIVINGDLLSSPESNTSAPGPGQWVLGPSPCAPPPEGLGHSPFSLPDFPKTTGSCEKSSWNAVTRTAKASMRGGFCKIRAAEILHEKVQIHRARTSRKEVPVLVTHNQRLGKPQRTQGRQWEPPLAPSSPPQIVPQLPGASSGPLHSSPGHMCCSWRARDGG